MNDAQTDKLIAALARAQAVMANPPRNREVTVRMAKGGSYTFRYATLDRILETVRKPLAENGLCVSQALENGENGKYRLVTRLLHESGQSLQSRTPLLVEHAGNQAFGSALTYMRRYALTALLGIAADEDDDANAADGNVVETANSTDHQPPTTGHQPPDNGVIAEPPRPNGQAGTDWIAWGAQMAEAMQNPNRGNLKPQFWMERNHASLMKCKKEAPKVYARLVEIAQTTPNSPPGSGGVAEGRGGSPGSGGPGLVRRGQGVVRGAPPEPGRDTKRKAA